MFVIAHSLELRALPYALNLSPRAAASFNNTAGADGTWQITDHIAPGTAARFYRAVEQ